MGMTLTVAGWVVADPEERRTAKGEKMTTIVVCPFGMKDEKIYVTVMIIGEHLDRVLQYVAKGKHVLFIGSLQKPDVYVNKAGEPKARIKIFGNSLSLLPNGERRESPAPKSEASILEDQLTTGQEGAPTVNDLEERLPF